MRTFILVFFVSASLGLIGLVMFSTREPWGVWQGYPFAYSFPNACGPGQFPNPFNGCGWSYDLSMVVLDYLFWSGISALGVVVVRAFWNRFAYAQKTALQT